MFRKKASNVKQLDDVSTENVQVNELEHPFINYLTANLADLEHLILENKADKSYLLSMGARYKEELRASAAKLREMSSFCFSNTEISMTYKTAISENEMKKFKILIELGYRNAELVPMRIEQKNPDKFMLTLEERKKYKAMLIRGYTDWQCVPTEFKFDNQIITLSDNEIEKFAFLLFEKYLQVEAIPLEVVKDKILLSESELDKYKYLLMSGCVSESHIPKILEVQTINKVFTSSEYYKIYDSISSLISKNILRQPDLEWALLYAERWIFIAKLAFESGDYFTASIIYNSMQSIFVNSPCIDFQKISHLENELSTQSKSVLDYLNSVSRQKIRLHAIQKQQFFSKTTSSVIPNLVALFSKVELISNGNHKKHIINKKVLTNVNLYKEMQSSNSNQSKNVSVINRVMFKDLLEYFEIKNDSKEAYKKNAARNHVKLKKINHQTVIDNLVIYNSNDKLYSSLQNLSKAKAKLGSMLNTPDGVPLPGYNKVLLKSVYEILISPDKDEVKFQQINMLVKLDDKRIHQTHLNEYQIILKELEILISLKYHRWQLEGHPDSKNVKVIQDKAKEHSSKEKTISTRTKHPHHAMLHRKKGDPNIRHSISSIADLDTGSSIDSHVKSHQRSQSDKIQSHQSHLHSSTKSLLSVMADNGINQQDNVKDNASMVMGGDEKTVETSRPEKRKLKLTMPEYTQSLTQNTTPELDVASERININALISDRRDVKENNESEQPTLEQKQEDSVSQLPGLLSHRHQSLYHPNNPNRGNRVSVLIQNIEQFKEDMECDAQRVDSMKAKK